MGLGDLAVIILKHVRARPMDHADPSPGGVPETGRVFAGFNPTSTRFHADAFTRCNGRARYGLTVRKVKPAAAATCDISAWSIRRAGEWIWKRLVDLVDAAPAAMVAAWAFEMLKHSM